VLAVLKILPIGSRNSITESKIEEHVVPLANGNEMHTAALASEVHLLLP
jgi:hypothetical protein